MGKWRGSAPRDDAPDLPPRTPPAAAERAAAESDVRDVLAHFAAALRAKDVGTMLALCGPEIVAFDLRSPSRHVGVDAVGGAWRATLDELATPVACDLVDVRVVVSRDVAFAHGSCELRGGRTTLRLRMTFGLERAGGRWRIAHQHASAACDPASGRTVLDASP